MRPKGLVTRIFLDGGDPEETREIINVLGFLDGQTTNPTLISKNPEVERTLKEGNFFSQDEILATYRDVVTELSELIPEGSVSIEVNADENTSAEDMLTQAEKMFSWIPNAHVKFPTIPEGLRAAAQAAQKGIRMNMTLCFTQEQAAAVHAATKGATKGAVFVSPFVGRLDAMGYDGMELIKNILEMYRKESSHVEVLAASVRHMDHLMMSLRLQADIITCPYKVLEQWAEKGFPVPGEDFKRDPNGLKPIPYREFELTRSWEDFTFKHDLIDNGLKRFAEDWIKLTGKTPVS